MKATSDNLTSILQGPYVYGRSLMTCFPSAVFWSSFLFGRNSGEQFSLHSFSLTLSSRAASMLLNCNAVTAAVSSSLLLNHSTYFFIAYSFPIFRAQPNKNNSLRVIKVAPHFKKISLQIFFKIVVCTSSISCINGRTIAANISSVIRRSGRPAKFNFWYDSKF